jgi:hypothetical protein
MERSHETRAARASRSGPQRPPRDRTRGEEMLVGQGQLVLPILSLVSEARAQARRPRQASVRARSSFDSASFSPENRARRAESPPREDLPERAHARGNAPGP